MLPLYTPEGVLASLQYIDRDGGKLYHPGGQTSGHYWMIGQFDGILGLAFKTISEDSMTPVFQSFVEHKLLDEVSEG